MNTECTLCPHKCKVDRKSSFGRCLAGTDIEIRRSLTS